jgi:hypothetical protein
MSGCGYEWKETNFSIVKPTVTGEKAVTLLSILFEFRIKGMDFFSIIASSII